MRTAPVIASYTEVAFSTTATTMTSATVTWKSGDVILVMSASESNDTFGTPTATGLTFSSIASNNAASTCGTILAKATAAADGSSAIAQPGKANGAQHGGVAIWVLRGCEGVGTPVEQHTSGKTVALTPTRKKSLVVWGVFDFSAAALIAETPTASNDRRQLPVASAYTVYVEELTPLPSTAPLAVGLGAGTSGTLSILGVEVFGSGRNAPVRSSNSLR